MALEKPAWLTEEQKTNTEYVQGVGWVLTHPSGTSENIVSVKGNLPGSEEVVEEEEEEAE
tara:strand:- start:7624 stop:7803 length:180 start_codon:yes stop_codon:yes gene_type:complete